MSTINDKKITSKQIQPLYWQFQLTWKLASFHLQDLTYELCFWDPVQGSLTFRQTKDVEWYPDWVEPDPDPPPPVTVGWVTWHLTWWWTSLLAAIKHELPLPHNQVPWPGGAGAVKRCLETLAGEWRDRFSKLEEGELDRLLAYPWAEPRPLRFALTWANSELMKNVAELGYIRHLYLASLKGDEEETDDKTRSRRKGEDCTPG